MTTMQKVVSTNLEEIGYDALNMALYVRFKSGKIYRYTDVPDSVWQAFQAASSLGNFLNTQIKPHYQYMTVDGADMPRASDGAASAVPATSTGFLAWWQGLRPDCRRVALF